MSAFDPKRTLGSRPLQALSYHGQRPLISKTIDQPSAVRMAIIMVTASIPRADKEKWKTLMSYGLLAAIIVSRWIPTLDARQGAVSLIATNSPMINAGEIL